MTDRAHRQETKTHLLPDHLRQPDGGRRRAAVTADVWPYYPPCPFLSEETLGGSAMHESPRAPLIDAPGPCACVSQVAAMGKARAVEEVIGTAHGDQQRTVPLELSHRISLAGEAIVDLAGELDIASAEVAVSYVRDVIDRHGRPVIADLTALAFCDARGLAALVRMAGYAEQRGCTFQLTSPSLSLVKIMRITGLDRRFLAFQVPDRLRAQIRSLPRESQPTKAR
jgi:anti-anti-sigma factor